MLGPAGLDRPSRSEAVAAGHDGCPPGRGGRVVGVLVEVSRTRHSSGVAGPDPFQTVRSYCIGVESLFRPALLHVVDVRPRCAWEQKLILTRCRSADAR